MTSQTINSRNINNNNKSNGIDNKTDNNTNQ